VYNCRIAKSGTDSVTSQPFLRPKKKFLDVKIIGRV
jgi:hypothetical protein